uniref:(California timema) hypothetical protein n=1 Tax=Timema californicum TaxID=61474 RepID=A0A7R9P4T4_TIMCA|nr:unnamed protein product [Timema californicum]
MNEVGLRTPSFTVMVKDALLLFIRVTCYGIVTVPTGPWFCRKCESQERAARVTVLCHYHSWDCAQTMLCASCVMPLPFTLTGLCTDHMRQLCRITTIHTHRIVHRPCCAPAVSYQPPFTLTGLCTDHVVRQLCCITTIHTHRTVRRPCCAPAVSYHYHSHSQDCAQTMLCASCVISPPFTLTGLCTDHVVCQLCHATSIHTHKTVHRPCCAPAVSYHYHSHSQDCAQTMLCTSCVVSPPFTLIGLCTDHVVRQLCRITTIHIHRTVHRPCCAPAVSYHYHSHSQDCAQTICANCVVSLPFTLTGLCTDHVVRQLCRITTIHTHRTVHRPCCAPAVSYHYNSYSQDCAPAVLCCYHDVTVSATLLANALVVLSSTAEDEEIEVRISRCELCPSRDGALKRTDNGGWAHVVCALYIPEVRFGNVTTMEPIMLQLIPQERFSKLANALVVLSSTAEDGEIEVRISVCYICEEQGKGGKATVGACMQCNKSGCKQQFHVTCAQALGLLCEEAGNYLDNVKYCGYCQHHYSKLKKSGNVKTIPPYKPVSADIGSDSSPDKDSDIMVKSGAAKRKGGLKATTSVSGARSSGGKAGGHSPSVGEPNLSLAGSGTDVAGDANKRGASLEGKETTISISAMARNNSAGSTKFTTSNFVETVVTQSESVFGAEGPQQRGPTTVSASNGAGKKRKAGGNRTPTSGLGYESSSDATTLTNVMSAPTMSVSSAMSTSVVHNNPPGMAGSSVPGSADNSSHGALSVDSKKPKVEVNSPMTSVLSGMPSSMDAGVVSNVNSRSVSMPSSNVITSVASSNPTSNPPTSSIVVSVPLAATSLHSPAPPQPSVVTAAPTLFQQLQQSVLVNNAANAAAAAAASNSLDPVSHPDDQPGKRGSRSPSTRKRLHTVMEEMVLPVLELIQFVDTRWSSEYNMLSRLHAVRKAVGAELANSENNIEILTEVEWKQAAGIVEVLGPLADATKEISGDNKALKSRFSFYDSDPIFCPSMLCDPRFRGVLIDDMVAVNTLAIEVKKLSDKSSLEPNVKDEHPSCSSSSSGLWSSFDSIPNTTQPAIDNNSEVKDYLNEPRVPISGGGKRVLENTLMSPRSQSSDKTDKSRKQKRGGSLGAPAPPVANVAANVNKRGSRNGGQNANTPTPPPQPPAPLVVKESPPSSPGSESMSGHSAARKAKSGIKGRGTAREDIKDIKLFQNGVSAPHMLGNQLNPSSTMAQKMSDTLSAELEAHSIFTDSNNTTTTSLMGPQLHSRVIASARSIAANQSGSGTGATNITAGSGSNAANSTAAAAGSIPQSLDQLLERQWEQGSQFLMEQAQHFDIASLLSCLHQLRAENLRLEEHVNSLLQRRDHLLAVNARLAIPLTTQPATQVNNVHPGSGTASHQQDPSRNARINNTYLSHPLENGLPQNPSPPTYPHQHRSPMAAAASVTGAQPSPTIRQSPAGGGYMLSQSPLNPPVPTSNIVSANTTPGVVRSTSATPEVLRATADSRRYSLDYRLREGHTTDWPPLSKAIGPTTICEYDYNLNALKYSLLPTQVSLFCHSHPCGKGQIRT